MHQNEENKTKEEILLYDGKYCFIKEGVDLKCLRYGKEWREFIGDNAIHALFDYAKELEKYVPEATVTPDTDDEEEN